MVTKIEDKLIQAHFEKEKVIKVLFTSDNFIVALA